MDTFDVRTPQLGQWRGAPLPPLEAGETGNDAARSLPGITNDQREAAKSDQMCEKIDHSLNVLTLNTTAHLMAADHYYKMYLLLAIGSIAFSSIVGVLGRFVPLEMVGPGM